MATIEQAEERMVELLGYPNPDTPNRHQRLTYLYLATDLHAKYLEKARQPHLVDSFRLTVNAGRNDYPVPVDDFAGLHYVATDPGATGSDFYEVEVCNFADADLLGVGPPASGGRVEKIGWRGLGEDRVLLTYPVGATGTLTCWYKKALPQPNEQSLADEVPMLEDFQMSLVPAAAALAALWCATWPGLPPEGNQARRDGCLNPNNPMSLKSFYESQLGLFVNRAERPNTAHPSKRPHGFGHVRRQARRRR